MLAETKDILYKLQVEGIGTSIASMHRGLDLLAQLIECEPEVAIKYFKGVAGACEHISSKFLGEGYIPNKTSKANKVVKSAKVNEQIMPKDSLGIASFVLDGMRDIPSHNSAEAGAGSNVSPLASMSNMALAAESVL